MDLGIFDDIDIDVYHSDREAISKSGLTRFAENPARFRFGKQAHTRPLFIGNLIHHCVLEPNTMTQRYYRTSLKTINPEQSKTRDEQSKAGSRELVKDADWDRAMRIRDAIMREPVAKQLLTDDLIVERSAWWADPETGETCRMRADGINKRMGAIIDLKSTEDASANAFSATCGAYHYHWQDYIYRTGMLLADGWDAPGFVFMAVEKEEPFLVGFYELDRRSIQKAADDVRYHMRGYAECRRTNIWPGHSQEIETISIPARSFNEY